MPARIVMVTGDKFVIDMDVNRTASDILMGPDRLALLETRVGDEPKRVYVVREHIAYAEAYEESEPFVDVH
jgi:hypothetical protein